QLGPETGPLAAGQQLLRPLAGAAVQFPERDAGRPANVPDHARLGDLGEDERSPAHYVVAPDRPGELLLVLDPILQRHPRRAPTRMSGHGRPAAASVWKLLTQTSKNPPEPISAGSSVADTCTSKLPFTLRTRSPCSRRARRCAPRAIKCTSAPAWASRPP